MTKKTIKLKNGFTAKVDENIFHNMRLLDKLAESKEDGSEFSNVVKLILGVEQREKLYEHIEKKGETPTAEALGEIIQEISEALGEQAKN